jgi:hypothetical protein
MTRCLTDVELQAVADHEADAGTRAHAAECPACAARVQETRRTLEAFGALTDRLPGPSIDLERRVQQTMHAHRTTRERGATTLRRQTAGRVGWGGRAWVSGLAAAALVVLTVFVIWPGVSRESHLSAAEILGRSLQTFSATSGVETFEYDVRFEGLANRALVPEPDAGGGALRITQVIDHDHPGRYRVMSVDAAQTLRSALVQDPARGTRVGRFRIDDHTYFFKFTASPDNARSLVSLPELQRTHLRALVSVMQGTADQKLTTVNDETGTYYAIQVPPMSSGSAPGAGAGGGSDQTLWDLSEAHALIDAGDFHLKELSARGTFLGQPFGLAFTLVRHDVTPSGQIAADAFTLEPQPDDIMLEGEATNDPPGDVVLAALRALGKARP